MSISPGALNRAAALLPACTAAGLEQAVVGIPSKLRDIAWNLIEPDVAVPTGISVAAGEEGTCVRLNWTPAEGADSYCVYKKQWGGQWKLAAQELPYTFWMVKGTRALSMRKRPSVCLRDVTVVSADIRCCLPKCRKVR